MNKLTIKWVLLLVAVMSFTSFAAMKVAPKPQALVAVTDLNTNPVTSWATGQQQTLQFRITNSSGVTIPGVQFAVNDLASDKTKAAALSPRFVINEAGENACKKAGPLDNGKSCVLTLNATFTADDVANSPFKDDYITVCPMPLDPSKGEQGCASASNDNTYNIIKPVEAGKIEFPGSNQVRLQAVPTTKNKLHATAGETGVISIRNSSNFPITLTPTILENSGWSSDNLSITAATGSSFTIPAGGTGTYDFAVLKNPDPAAIGNTNQDIAFEGVDTNNPSNITNTIFMKIDYIPGTAVGVSPVEVTGDTTFTSDSGDGATKVAKFTNDTSSSVNDAKVKAAASASGSFESSSRAPACLPLPLPCFPLPLPLLSFAAPS